MILRKAKFNKFRQIFIFAAIFLCSIVVIKAQSSDQNFPTPVTTNQIDGTIKARDLGDSRLTTYYYVFSGTQGDIFVNVVTKNFDGDIDIFTLNNLKPLTKIRVFSDSSDNETGRIVYLRQPEKLLLRIEGRTPNDEPATFQIKFAGSFVAEKPSNERNDVPQVKNANQGDVRVNSVGTIVETKPKPTPKPAETPAKPEAKQEEVKEEKTEVAEQKEEVPKPEPKVEKPAVEVIVTDNLSIPKPENKEEKPAEKTEKTPKNAENADNKTEEKEAKEQSAENKTEVKEQSVAEDKKEEKESNPLEKIKLVIVFKNGTKIERPMSEILNVNIDKGILTVIAKDGTIGRYSILDVVEMTIK